MWGAKRGPLNISNYFSLMTKLRNRERGPLPCPERMSSEQARRLSQSDIISMFSFTETFQRLLNRNPIIIMPFNKISLDNLILLSTVFIIIELIKMFSQSGSPSSFSELPTLIRAGAKISQWVSVWAVAGDSTARSSHNHGPGEQRGRGPPFHQRYRSRCHRGVLWADGQDQVPDGGAGSSRGSSQSKGNIQKEPPGPEGEKKLQRGLWLRGRVVEL